MVGGDSSSLEKIRRILECMGNNMFYAGDVGCSNVAKLVNNMISLACTAINAEGFVLGTKAGIDPWVLWEIVKASTGNNRSLQQYPDGVFKGNYEPGFRLSLAYKDIGLALDLGKEYNIPLPVGTAVKQEFNEAISAGFIDKNISSVIIPMENAAKIKVRSSG
jgi:2-hydroxymethylglutarate dehydrogenase